MIELRFITPDNNPNLEIMDLGSDRFLMRQFDPDEPFEKWLFISPNEKTIVYQGSILPKTLISLMAQLVLEGQGILPQPSPNELRTRLELE